MITVTQRRGQYGSKTPKALAYISLAKASHTAMPNVNACREIQPYMYQEEKQTGMLGLRLSAMLTLAVLSDSQLCLLLPC
jgi:hypothetical protein